METLPALQNAQVEMLISQALDKQVSIETLERLLSMRKELKAEYAKEQFSKALSAFQAECPVIKKTKLGAVAKYAPIESILTQVIPFLNKNEFSYSFNSETTEDTVTAHFKLTHILGHSETTSFTCHHVIKNKAISLAQLDAGTLTFAKRIALCNGLGLVLADEDIDGYAPLISNEQLQELKAKLPLVGYSEEQVLKLAKISKLEELPYTVASDLLSKINEKLGG